MNAACTVKPQCALPAHPALAGLGLGGCIAWGEAGHPSLQAFQIARGGRALFPGCTAGCAQPAACSRYRMHVTAYASFQTSPTKSCGPRPCIPILHFPNSFAFHAAAQVGHAIGRHSLEKATLVYGGMFCIDILVGLADRLLRVCSCCRRCCSPLYCIAALLHRSRAPQAGAALP